MVFGRVPGAAAAEIREGVRFLRAGTATTVHLQAFRRYARRKDFDLVVDEINTIPFFTPWYAARSVALIFQLAREVWLYEGGALGRFGYAAEPFYLRPYRTTPLLTISESSAQTLRAIGLRGPLRIVPIAVDEPADEAVPAKTLPRDLMVVGRVTPSKRIEESVEAAALLRDGGWTGRLRIVGSGPSAYRAALEGRIAELGLGDVVTFTGRVDDDARRELMRAASALWMTSAREGWGLVVTEAARHGTPSVVYDVPGLARCRRGRGQRTRRRGSSVRARSRDRRDLRRLRRVRPARARPRATADLGRHRRRVRPRGRRAGSGVARQAGRTRSRGRRRRVVWTCVTAWRS